MTWAQSDRAAVRELIDEPSSDLKRFLDHSGKKIQMAEKSVLGRIRRERDEIHAHWHRHAER